MRPMRSKQHFDGYPVGDIADEGSKEGCENVGEI